MGAASFARFSKRCGVFRIRATSGEDSSEGANSNFWLCVATAESDGEQAKKIRPLFVDGKDRHPNPGHRTKGQPPASGPSGAKVA